MKWYGLFGRQEHPPIMKLSDLSPIRLKLHELEPPTSSVSPQPRQAKAGQALSLLPWDVLMPSYHRLMNLWMLKA
jgi:hypothetical protein